VWSGTAWPRRLRRYPLECWMRGRRGDACVIEAIGRPSQIGNAHTQRHQEPAETQTCRGTLPPTPASLWRHGGPENGPTWEAQPAILGRATPARTDGRGTLAEGGKQSSCMDRGTRADQGPSSSARRQTIARTALVRGSGVASRSHSKSA